MSLSHSPLIVRDGLVLCLDAANPRSYPKSGTAWSDLKGSNDGTLTNMDAANFNQDGKGSLTFDGTNEYGMISDSDDFTVTETTACAWFKSFNFNSSQDNRGIVSSYDSSGRQYYGLRTDAAASNNKLYTYYDDNAGYGFSILRSTTSLTINTWYYGCMTWKSGNFHRVYLNGIQEAEETNVATTTLNITTGFYIGKDNATSTKGFYGNISNVSIYNRALTAAEVLQNYNATRGRYGI